MGSSESPVITFIARNDCPHLEKVSNVNAVRTYLYGNLNQWKIDIESMSQDDVKKLLKNVSLCEEIVDVNVEDHGDIRVDSGYIHSSLVPMIDEDINVNGHVMSQYEKRIVEEITEAFGLDSFNNLFNKDQQYLRRYETPRKMISMILVDIAMNTFDHNKWLQDTQDDSLRSFTDNFRINVHCDRSEIIGRLLCSVTLGLVDEDTEISKSYLSELPEGVQADKDRSAEKLVESQIKEKNLITSWGLFYYATTQRLSIGALPNTL